MTTPTITTADGIFSGAVALFSTETRAVVRDDVYVDRLRKGYALCVRESTEHPWRYLCRFPTLEAATVPGAGLDEADAAWRAVAS